MDEDGEKYDSYIETKHNYLKWWGPKRILFATFLVVIIRAILQLLVGDIYADNGFGYDYWTIIFILGIIYMLMQDSWNIFSFIISSGVTIFILFKIKLIDNSSISILLSLYAFLWAYLFAGIFLKIFDDSLNTKEKHSLFESVLIILLLTRSYWVWEFGEGFLGFILFLIGILGYIFTRKNEVNQYRKYIFVSLIIAHIINIGVLPILPKLVQG